MTPHNLKSPLSECPPQKTGYIRIDGSTDARDRDGLRKRFQVDDWGGQERTVGGQEAMGVWGAALSALPFGLFSHSLWSRPPAFDLSDQ